jgi:UDP-N-acetyl-2-amino-2-deoxyglucuronate dehydrogenase
MMNEKVNFSVVGAGFIGKRHADLICNNAQANLSAFVDVLNKQQLGIEKYNVPLYTTVEEMIANTNTDVVCVATPNGLHRQHALSALAAGKHVVIEKPMALNVKDAEQIIAKAAEMNKQVFCVMQNRYSPPSIWLKDIIDSGVLGKIYLVQINCYWNRDDRYYSGSTWKGTPDMDGGSLFTQFSHFVDMMYWLFGDIENIDAKFQNFNHSHLTAFEDTGIINFDFVNAGIGTLHYSTAVWDKNLESSITIIAENGTVKVGGQYMNNVSYCHIKDYIMPALEESMPANDYGAYKGSAANHKYVFENVIEVLKGKSTITTSALEAQKVVNIIERIYQLK